MKTLIALFILALGPSLYAETKSETEKFVAGSETVLPDTVDISNEIIEINKDYVRDLASEKEEDGRAQKEGDVQFWLFD
ncbi:MAG: hypothetical protein H6621_01050 [Halobacteriovoraceae bacterium]|nr:hypothetical protein [Halobacteriovoraceae bacterium]MCB9093629.1 hypothetical protein [Halobacteriovoraceae bacterium]